MKNQLLLATTLVLGLLFVISAPAEIFLWVDENGKTHFGDRVPERYKSEANDITDKVSADGEASGNVMKSIDYKQSAMEDRQRRLNSELERNRRNQQRSANGFYSVSKKAATGMDHPSTCADEWARFESAKACYEGCQVTYTHGRWPHYSQNTNTAACGHCTDVKKPKCRK